MKTASHFSYKGPGRVVISLGNPRGVPGGYRMFKTLAPEREWMNAPYFDYRRQFMAKLEALDAQATWDKLHELAGEGNEPVLQCFEKPPFNEGSWCHRRMVSEWFERELGVKVPELGYDGPDYFGR